MPMGGPGPGGRNPAGVKPKNVKQSFSRILSYFGKNKFLLLIVFLSLILSTVCSTAASYWLKPILDDVATSIKAGTFADEGIKTLIKNLAIVSAFYVGAAVFTFLQSKIMVKVAYKSTNAIRKDLFDRLQTLPLKYFDTKTHGEIMSRFTNDVDNIQMMLEQTIVQLISSVFTFIGIVVMMIVLEWRLFFVACIFLVIMLVNSLKIAKSTRKYYKAQQAALGEMNGNIEETVEGMKVVKVFNHEQQAIDDFEVLNEKYRSAATNANFYSGIMGPCSTGINNASYASITLVGGILVLSSTITIGTFFTFLSYSKQFTQPINQIMNQMNNISPLLPAQKEFLRLWIWKAKLMTAPLLLRKSIPTAAKNGFGLTELKKLPLRVRSFSTMLHSPMSPTKLFFTILTFMPSRVKKLHLSAQPAQAKLQLQTLSTAFMIFKRAQSPMTALI